MGLNKFHLKVHVQQFGAENLMQNLQRYSCTAAVYQQRQVVHNYHANCDISNKADKLLHSFKTVTCNSDRQPVWLSHRVQ